jgi:hypothetical protein
MLPRENVIANCLSNIRNLLTHRYIARFKEVSHERLLKLVKESSDQRTYKDLKEIIDALVRAGLVFSVGDQTTQLQYRSTHLSTRIYERINEVYEQFRSSVVSTPERETMKIETLETLAEIFEILSQEDRITIVDLLSWNKKGIDRKKLERMVHTKGSFNHNITQLNKAEIIRVDGMNILSGENMKKISIPLEILRSSILDARRYLESLKPTVEHVMLSTSELGQDIREFSNEETLGDALNYVGHSNSRFLLLHAPNHNRPFVADRFDLTRARWAGSKFSDNLEEVISTMSPIWLYITTSLFDPSIREVIDRKAIGTVIDSSGFCIGIVRAEEISNFLDAYAIETPIAYAEIKQGGTDDWINKGTSLLESAEYAEAIKYYDKVIAVNPNYAKGWFYKGAALAGLDKHEEAIECFDKALEIEPSYLTVRPKLPESLEINIIEPPLPKVRG